MKALTNILTHLLMLLMIFIMACTEEAVEVNNLSRQEQHVTVRMQVPGMTAATTRAADDVIESVTALAFDTNGNLLEVVSATNITTEGFNLTVPNGTTTIHFLANLPENYDLSGVKDVVDLTKLTTTDYNNLVYWGMATYDGSNSTLSTTLYRNMAKISIKPSEGEDAALNVFKQNDLTIAGLVNANTSGTLVPYNGGFYVSNSATAPEFLTLPNPAPTRQNIEYNSLPNFVYAFEHENDNYEGFVLHVICKIGTYYYKVALIDENSNPYDIIRNHEYIIYVSDVDDYAHDDNYRASSYNDALGKKPINLEVKQIAQVAFSNTNDKTIDWNNGNPNGFDVAMSNIAEGTVTLTIAAKGFQVTQDGNELQKVEDNYIYTGGNTTFTFKPTAIGSHQITITGTGIYAKVPTTTINVTVQASIKAEANKAQLYYDSNEEQTVTVNVTIPTGVETLNISAADFIFGEEVSGSYTYAVNSQTSAALSFKLKSGIQEAKTSTITISDASGNATQALVNINLVETPVVTFSPDESSKTMSINDTYTITMNVPNGGTLTSLNIAAEGFTVASASGGLNDPVDNVYSYAGGTTTFTFTPTSAGSRTIRFSDGQGENINVPEKNISVTVNASIIATATPSTIYHDGDDKTVTVRVTIPKGVSGLEIVADDFSVALQDGNGTLIDNTYTPNDTNGQTAVFVFTYTGESTSGTSIIEISDKDNSEYVDDAEVGISVTNKPVAGANTELLEEGEVIEFSTTNDSNCMLLKSNNNETGDAIAASYKSKFTKGTRLSVNFNCVVIQYGRNPVLKLSSIWGTTFATYQYKAEDALEQTLIYEFTASDIETINNAGLQLVGNNVTITQITIIPASTTE